MTRTSHVAVVLMTFCLAAAPSLARAADDSQASRIWLASDADGGYGRLALQAAHLAFHSMHGTDDWEIDLADAKRIEVSKTADKVIEIETVSGEKFTFTVLDSRMVADSPRKALQAISVALKNAGSAKVVGVNGRQIR